MSTFALYKPFGMLSQFTRELPHHVTLQDLEFEFSKNVYPIGRLDADSEGLLLLSDQPGLNALILSPKQKWPKTYAVQVEGVPGETALEPLRRGITLKIKKKTIQSLPARIQILSSAPSFPERHPPIRIRQNIPTTWLTITLEEGKNRQVRKMLAHIGFPVLRLVRTQIGNLHIQEVFGPHPVPGQVVPVDEAKLRP